MPDASAAISAAFEKKRLAAALLPDEMYAMLEKLEELDLFHERKARNWKIALIASIITCVICTIVFLVCYGDAYYVIESLDAWWKYVLFVGGPAIAFLALSLSFFLKNRRMDLSNEFRIFLMPILKRLRHDIKDGTPVTLDADMAWIDNDKYLSKKTAPVDSGAKKHLVYATYGRSLLKMTMRLADGNTLSLVCAEKLVRATWRKHTAKKVKSKQSDKKLLSFDLRLGVNTAAYRVPPLPGISAITVKQGRKGPVLSCDYREKFKARTSVSGSPEGYNPSTTRFLEGLASLYAKLEPLKP